MIRLYAGGKSSLSENDLFSISASSGGFPCAAYTSTPPRNAADFLELAENCPFLDRKLIRAFNETLDGHDLVSFDVLLKNFYFELMVYHKTALNNNFGIEIVVSALLGKTDAE